MKILHFINCFQRGGGAEKFLLDLALGENKLQNIEIRILSLIPINDSGFSDVVRKEGIIVDILSNSLYSPFNFWKMWRYLKINNFDVIHVHLFPALYFATVCKWMQKKKILLFYTEHSTYNRRRAIKIFKFLDSFFYGRYDRIFTISEKVKESLYRHIQGLPITVINNGVDIYAIEQMPITNIRKELDLSPYTIIITMVSRFAWMKDYLTVFKSMKELPTNVHFICVGDGDRLDESKQIVEAECLTDRIHFLGMRTDAISIMKGSDIIILSSKYEGFSISMLEAMACGKPFVASDVPGLNDNALGVADFFKYQDYNDLTRVINTLIEDKNHYNDIANRCYLHAKKFDINIVSKKYILEYQSAIL